MASIIPIQLNMCDVMCDVRPSTQFCSL